MGLKPHIPQIGLIYGMTESRAASHIYVKVGALFKDLRIGQRGPGPRSASGIAISLAGFCISCAWAGMSAEGKGDSFRCGF